MITVTNLMAFEPGPFTSAASTWEDVVGGLGGVTKMIGGVGGQLGDWEGAASAAASKSLGILMANATPATTLLSTVPSTVTNFASAVGAARDELGPARSAAVAAGCTVGEDGTVTPPAAPAMPAALATPAPASPTPAQTSARTSASTAYNQASDAHQKLVRQAAGWENTIKGALAKATAADQEASSTLDGMRSGAGGFAAAVTGGKEGDKGAESTWEQFTKIVDSGGHLNDYLGAGSTALIKSFDQALERAGASGDKFMAAVDGPDELLSLLKGSGDTKALSLLEAASKDADTALGKYPWANNPFVKFLTKGLPGDMPGGSVLEKVPLVGVAFTAFDIFDRLEKGDSILDATGEPLANLALGTATAEGVSALLAAQSLDWVPGVGEVIIAGTVAVGVVYGADKLGSYVWDHRQEIGAWAEHQAEEAAQPFVNAYQFGTKELGQFQQWADTTAPHVEHWTESAIGNVKTWGSSAVNNIETWGSNAATNAENWTSNAATNVENWGSGAVSTARSALHDAEPWNW